MTPSSGVRCAVFGLLALVPLAAAQGDADKLEKKVLEEELQKKPQDPSASKWRTAAKDIVYALRAKGIEDPSVWKEVVYSRIGPPPTKSDATLLKELMRLAQNEDRDREELNPAEPGAAGRAARRARSGETAPDASPRAGAAVEPDPQETARASRAQEQVQQGLASGGARTAGSAGRGSEAMRGALREAEQAAEEGELDDLRPLAESRPGARGEVKKAEAMAAAAKRLAASAAEGAGPSAAGSSSLPGSERNLPAALARYPELFRTIPKTAFDELKRDLQTPAMTRGPVLQDVGLSEGARDIRWSRSCSRVSGDCNALASGTSYKKGDYVPPQDLVRMHAALEVVRQARRPGAQPVEELPDLEMTPEEEAAARAAIQAKRAQPAKLPRLLAGAVERVKGLLGGIFGGRTEPEASEVLTASTAAGAALAGGRPAAAAPARPSRRPLSEPRPPAAPQGGSGPLWPYLAAGAWLGFVVWRVWVKLTRPRQRARA